MEPRDGRCRCGHDRDVHTHLRAGRDCGACGCPRYRPPLVRSTVRWVADRVDAVAGRDRGGR